MTKLYVNTIKSQTGNKVSFSDPISVNESKQWVDSYGIIKTSSKTTLDENVTIPSGTNGLSNGAITIKPGKAVTVNGEWSII